MCFCPTPKMKLPNQEAIDVLGQQQLTKLVDVELGWDENGNTMQNNNIVKISFLKEYVEMEKLCVYDIQITDLPLENAAKLKDMQLYKCKYLRNLSGLESCNGLEQILLYQLNITSILAIGELNKLKNVIIYSCKQITDYHVLESCTGLTYLRVWETNISDISPIVSIQNLETLDLRGNDQLVEQFQKNIKESKQQVKQLLDQWKRTQQYKNYKLKQQFHQLRVNLLLVQHSINQFKDNISKQVYQYKVNLVKTMKRIIQFQ